LELNQIVENDPTAGIIRFRQSGGRANLISSGAWASMKTKMFQSIGSGAASIFFGLGQFYGKEAGAAFISRFEQQPFDVFKYAAAWGKLTTEFSPDSLFVKIENCCFCEGIKLSQPVCFEFAGIMTATLNAISKDEISVKETDCIAKGDSICKFKVNMPDTLRHRLRSLE
jgi:predicted hydrocarbon binding protein